MLLSLAMRRGEAIASLARVTGLLLVGACSPGGSSGASSGFDAHNPVRVFADGFEGQGVPLRNGGSVALKGGLDAGVFVDPFPPSAARSLLDLYLRKEGQPVADAEVTMDNDMVSMAHGAFKADDKSAGDGHYHFSLKYPMVGVWRQRITIRASGQRYELPMVVTAFP